MTCQSNHDREECGEGALSEIAATAWGRIALAVACVVLAAALIFAWPIIR